MPHKKPYQGPKKTKAATGAKQENVSISSILGYLSCINLKYNNLFF
jgi:hypothetical protein